MDFACAWNMSNSQLFFSIQEQSTVVGERETHVVTVVPDIYAVLIVSGAMSEIDVCQVMHWGCVID